MNKKGFTLVELLAVIALLGVLAIVVLPNVIEGFKNSKSKNFLSEARELYKTAKSQYIYDRAKGFNTMIYQKGYSLYSGSNVKELDVSGRDTFKYIIKTDTSGEIVYFIVEDSDNKVELGDNSTPVQLKDIR